MQYLAYDKMSCSWSADLTSLTITLPWLTMEIGIDPQERPWIQEATERLISDPLHASVQKFFQNLQEYPVSWVKPRPIEAFADSDLCPSPSQCLLNYESPEALLRSPGMPALEALVPYTPKAWTWNWQECLDKAHIEGTDLYDPVAFVSYLILYRLDWESTTWCGQDGLGQLMEKHLRDDEEQFFWILGLISRQSWQVTQDSSAALETALTTIPQAHAAITDFIKDEAGHYKFMDMVFEDIGLNRDDFPVFPETRWMLDSHAVMAQQAPLAFAAMINLFEAAFYEGVDPISRVVMKSSKPHACRGYDLHYKINQEHRHCDMPMVVAQKLGPQRREQLELTLAVFELTLRFLDQAESRISSMVPQKKSAA